jgi:hypothetical protein
MKTGLIIAGPILSPGYTPYYFHEDGSYQKNWVDYDSSPNIINLVNQASDLFDHIVLVTWKTSNPSDLLTMLRSTTKVEIIELSENAFLIDELINKGRSKYHQIETMYAGAKKLGELGCDVIAKVRTTHGINLKILFDDLLHHTNRNKRSIGVSYMNLFERDRLVDYHFIGNTKVIESLCASYLSTPELFQGVHEDYYAKFANFLSENVNLNENRKLMDRILNYIRIISDWTQFFYPLNRKLLKNFYWRGVKVNSNLNFWIFWSFLFHAKNSRSLWIKTIGNIAIINLAQALIRPSMRLHSFFAYKFYRYMSAR